MRERYIRQEIIKEWNQELIEKTKVALIGDGFLATILSAGLASMGFGEITIISKDNTKEYVKNPLVKIYKKRAPVLDSTFLYSLLPKKGTEKEIDVIIECTNNLRSKKACLDYAKKEKKDVFLGSSTKSSLVFCSNTNGNKGLENLISFHYEDYANKEQGEISSVMLSAIITDELRKIRMPIRNDKIYDRPLNEYFYEGFCPLNLNKKILQIGAGAIGTFTAILLASTDSKVDIVDFDKIEESNLNRQFLFYDSIGKYKAEVMAKKLNQIKEKENFKAIVEKVDKNWKYFENSRPDLILGCVDNSETRLFLNYFASRYKIPIVDGGSSLTGSRATSYVPGKNVCLECQISLKESMKKERIREEKKLRGELKDEDCIDPSMIVPNECSGALMINEVLRMFDNKLDVSVHYSSGFGIKRTKIKVSNCKENCEYKNL